MSNSENNDQEFREWKFEAPNREYLLERRVKELEEAVSRLENELSRQKQSNYEKYISGEAIEIKAGSIGAVAGTIGTRGNIANVYLGQQKANKQ